MKHFNRSNPWPQDKETSLQQVRDEVARINMSLTRLSERERDASATGPFLALSEGDRARLLDRVRNIIRARRLRSEFLPKELFADPAWDMLLELLQAELAHVRLSITVLCEASAVPPTTALRWVKTLTDAKLLNRRPDQLDARRVFIELASTTSEYLQRYFQAIGHVDAA